MEAGAQQVSVSDVHEPATWRTRFPFEGVLVQIYKQLFKMLTLSDQDGTGLLPANQDMATAGEDAGPPVTQGKEPE